eukprot:scaffold1948_cov244-Pinguiococcus_pyrenoidosus.AAC.9
MRRLVCRDRAHRFGTGETQGCGVAGPRLRNLWPLGGAADVPAAKHPTDRASPPKASRRQSDKAPKESGLCLS